MVGKVSVTISDIRQDEWVNPFGASAEELIAGALDDGGLMDGKTLINGKNAQVFFQSYCRKKNLFQEATKLGNILVKEEVITADQLAQALQIQSESAKPLGEVLIAMKLCVEQDIEQALERQKSIREDFYRLEQAREARKGIWNRILRFFFDSRQGND